MVEFLKRMGGIAPLAGITIDQTLALGATLDSLGQTSEVSSTALSKLFVKLGTDAEKYAGLAGVEVNKFKDVLGKNALEAFILLLEGTKKTEGGVIALSETLGDIGIDAARAAGVFGVLGANTDRLREQMGLANTAFQEGTSITDEYKLKNENLAAELAKLGKEFNRLVANNTVTQWLSGLVGTTREAIDWLRRHKDTLVQFGKILLVATSAWATYRLSIIAATRFQAFAATATRAMGLAYGVLTGQITLASAATRVFNTVTKLNPLGLVLTALIAVIGYFATYTNELSNASSRMKAFGGAAKALGDDIDFIGQKLRGATRFFQEWKQESTIFRASVEGVMLVLKNGISVVVLALNAAIIQPIKLTITTIKALRLAMKGEFTAAQAEFAAFNKGLVSTVGATAKEIDDNFKQAMSSIIDPSVVGTAAANTAKAFNAATESTEVLEERLKRLYILREAFIKQGKLFAAGEGDGLIAQIEGELAKRAPNASTGLDPAKAKEEAAEILRTVKYLNEQIKALQDQQEGTTNAGQFQKIAAEIKKLEAERDRITGGNGGKKLAKTQEDLEKLLDEYRKFQAELSSDRLTADEQELAQLDAKHAEELKKVREQQTKLIKAGKLSPIDATTDNGVLVDNQAAERQALIEKQGDARMKALAEQNKKIQDALGAAHNEDMQMEVARLEEEIRMGQEHNQNVLGLQENLKDAQLRLYKQNATDLIAQEQEKWDALLEQAREALAEFDKAIEATGLEPSDGVLAERQQLTNAILDLEMAEKVSIENINKEHRQREKAANRKYSQEERQEYARRLQNFAMVADAVGSLISSITQYQDVGIAAAEARADADGVRTEAEIADIERLKTARRKAALTAIAVQSAVAVANGIASAMTLPWPANLAAAISTAAQVIGLFAQAKALMNESNSDTAQQQQVPQQAQLNNIPIGADGMVGSGDTMITSKEGGGVLPGQLHTDGGNNVVDTKTGKVVANVEKGEMMLVMSRKATQANADLIPALMKASREGTRLTPFDRPVALPDPSQVSQGLRVVHMAQGGFIHNGDANAAGPTPYSQTKSRTGLDTAPGDGNNDEVLGVLRQMMLMMGRTANATERFPTKLKATMSLVEAERRKIEYDAVLEKSRGRKAS